MAKKVGRTVLGEPPGVTIASGQVAFIFDVASKRNRASPPPRQYLLASVINRFGGGAVASGIE